MNKLEKYLKHHCISQRGFAKKIGTTPNNLGLLVKGKSMPGLKLAYEIEKMTGGLVNLYDWIQQNENADEINENLHLNNLSLPETCNVE